MQEAFEKRYFARILPVAWLLSLAPLAACEPAAIVEPPAPAVAKENSCGEGSGLETDLYGGIETTLSWSGSEMACESMRRPNGEGLRLRLSGDVSGETVAFIIALPELQPGQAGVESPSNVTMTVEGSGRFFSTPDLDSCWTDVQSQTPSPGADGQYTLRGTLLCVDPLGELNGDSAITIPRLEFTAVVNWT